MDAKEKEEYLEALQEVKELVDTAFPLESTVVRDQVLAMLAAATLRGVMLGRWAGPRGEPLFGFRHLAEWLSMMFAEYKVIHRENVIAQRQRVAAQLTEIAAQKGKEWTWEVYQEFKCR